MSAPLHVLLTGGAGFVGSHLAERLEAAGHAVTVLDDLSAGSPENLAGCRRARLVVGSVLDAPLVTSLVRSADRVVHLAATVGVERVAAAPDLARRVIADGSRIVLDACAARAVPALLVSSSEVYGFEPGVPVRETDPLADVRGTAPRLAYVRAKIDADRTACELSARGLPILAVRPFNVVGARQSDDGGAVLPRFVRRAARGLPLEVHGDGAQRRCFLEVRDAAAALADLALLDRFPCAAVNLGGAEEHSILALARRVVLRLGSRSPIVTVNRPPSRGGVDVPRRVPDLRRLEELLPDDRGRRHFTVDDAIDALAAAAPAPAVPALAAFPL